MHDASFPAIALVMAVMASTPAFAQVPPDAASAASQHRHPSDPSGFELFPARDASGTAWLPNLTPVFGARTAWRGWDIMLHGNAFAQFLYEPGERHRTGGFGTRQLGSVNWGMAMARRRAGVGRLGVRTTISLEPWTIPGCGYLSLLATGETCDGDTIHDRQHPHDLFMEVAADYDRPLRGTLRWQVYAGLAGEPALGPAGFPHRASALVNPIAPVAHHWLDATHITFGLVTTGLYDRRWKLEASLFNGREPDEDRFDLDLASLDSFSGRLTVLPNDRLALQVSVGHLHDAEAGVPPHPRSSVNRATTSATYHRALAGDGFWATTIAYGLNSGREVVDLAVLDAVTQAVLLESSLTVRGRHTWFGRTEIVEKPAHDLHVHEFPTRVFTVAKLQGGYVRHFKPRRRLESGLGASVSVSAVPPELASRYGGRLAPGFAMFVHVRPRRHDM